MIQTREPTLSDYVHCARNICADERDTYIAMLGTVWAPDDIAARLWLEGGKRWTFWETVGNFPAAVGGYMQTGDSWGSWFMGTPAAWARGNQITERVAECIRSMFDDPSVQLLVTVTLATRTRAREWYERLGLTYVPTARDTSAKGQELATYVMLRPSGCVFRKS